MAKKETYGKLHRELEALYAKHKGLNPKIVVEWARQNKTSALHKRFEWNNSKAAEQYRLWQAREIITEVEVIYPDGKKRQIYVSPVKYRGNVGYRTLVDVLSNERDREQFLLEALEEYRRLGEKYEDLQELAGVRTAVQKVAAKVAKSRAV